MTNETQPAAEGGDRSNQAEPEACSSCGLETLCGTRVPQEQHDLGWPSRQITVMREAAPTSLIQYGITLADSDP